MAEENQELDEQLNQDEVEDTESEQVETEVEVVPPEEDEIADITIDGEESTASQESDENAPAWVKEVRADNKAKNKRIRELELELAKHKAPQNEVPKLRDKPTLEGHDFDAEAFEKDIESWFKEKAEVDNHELKAKAEQADVQKNFETRKEYYVSEKTNLKLPDFDESEATVASKLSEVQQQVVLLYAENPARVIYVLGKNPKKLEEIAAIKDPIKQAIEIRSLEAKLKVIPRKKPNPEEKVTGVVPKGEDTRLEELRKKAARTNDYSEVAAYKREQQKK